MGKKMFFLSLIILSVAMGINWQKNRPKTKPGKVKARTALNLKDLQLQDEPTGVDGEQIARVDNTDDISEGENPDNPKKLDEEETPEDTTSEATATADVGSDDQIIFALQNMRRNPFERSPYAQLVIELQKKEEITAQPIEKKSVKLLNANFTATIETRKELVAVIDSRLYRKGELFQDKKISEIKAELVSLESGRDTFLIPKSGVNVSIAEDGTYTVVDNFHKN